MQQWWEAVNLFSALLRDADALGLSRETRNRLVVAIGALDDAMLACAAVECPLRVKVPHASQAPLIPKP